MRDPRLVEIDFLMNLDREGQLAIIGLGETQLDGCFAGGAARGNRDSTAQVYGTDPRRFLQMVDYLLNKRLILSPQGVVGLSAMHPENEIPVQLTHAGRVHLWNLRDSLLRDHDLDEYGLKRKAAWNRDLFLSLRWATKEEPLSVIFVDLDNFGLVNKELGHPTGDAVLRVAFRLINEAAGPHGPAYRYGGEEVGVLLPLVALEKATGVAEEIRSLLEREVHVQVDKLTAPQTASIGVASFDSAIENDAAVAKVDGLMRAAKRAGKNRVETVG